MASSITLSWRLLEELSLLLNPKLPVNDWRSLAGLLGYSVKDILNFDRAKNPTLAFLVDWSTRNVEENTISVLIRHLTEMNRHDAVDLLKPHEFIDSPVKSTNGTPSGENVVTHSQSLRGESAGEDDENLQTIRIKNVRSLKRLSEGQTSEPSQGATLLIAGRNDTKCAKLVSTEVKEDTPPNKRIPQDENHFNQDIGYLVQLFDQNTRKWLFDRVDDWFKNEPNSRVMVLSACAGVGKSVFAAKVCDVFATRGQLAGYHFCKFNMTDYSNPHTMLQPLASHLCENVPGFEEIFLKQMQLPHPKETVRDAFRDLNDPLHSLGEREPMLIVIDALDESETGGKSELIDLISREFTKLPKWIRVFVTSRPGLPVQKTLRHLKAVEVRVGNKDNDNDLKCFVGGFLTGISRNKSLVKRLVAKCNGSFLIAYHLKLFILEGKKRNSLNVTALASDLRVSETINDIYRRYFDHLMAELGKLAPGTSFRPILEILIAASGPLPLSFMGEVLGLPASLSLPVHELTVVIREANKSVFKLLVIYDDCVTVFHKSVFDWLKSDGCEMHVYTVNPVNGDEHLWRLCKSAIEKFESQSPDEKKTKGQDYALLHGVQHGVYRAQISWSESPDYSFMLT